MVVNGKTKNRPSYENVPKHTYNEWECGAIGSFSGLYKAHSHTNENEILYQLTIGGWKNQETLQTW